MPPMALLPARSKPLFSHQSAASYLRSDLLHAGSPECWHRSLRHAEWLHRNGGLPLSFRQENFLLARYSPLRPCLAVTSTSQPTLKVSFLIACMQCPETVFLEVCLHV